MAEKILRTQMPVPEKMVLSDCVVWNDGSVSALQAQAQIFAASLSFPAHWLSHRRRSSGENFSMA
jgi:dephospho-CoA kinase